MNSIRHLTFVECNPGSVGCFLAKSHLNYQISLVAFISVHGQDRFAIKSNGFLWFVIMKKQSASIFPSCKP